MNGAVLSSSDSPQTSRAAKTRDQIVEAADRLFYERGYEATSFSDIAKAVGLSRGNFYYHFRTKDEILDAVIARRMRDTQSVIAGWQEDCGGPIERILAYFRIVVRNRESIMVHGCPVGTLTGELAKSDHPALGDATAIFALFRSWLACQFTALGHERDANAFAMHVLMRSQGIATITAAFRDEAFIRREATMFEDWLAELTDTSLTDGDGPCS